MEIRFHNPLGFGVDVKVGISFITREFTENFLCANKVVDFSGVLFARYSDFVFSLCLLRVTEATTNVRLR